MVQITTRNNLRHYDRRLAALGDDKTPVQIREKVRGLRDQGKLPRPNDLPDGSSSDPDEDMPVPDEHDSDDLPEVDDAAEEVLAAGPEWDTSLTLAWLATGQSGTLEDALKKLIQGQEELSQKSVDEYVTQTQSRLPTFGLNKRGVLSPEGPEDPTLREGDTHRHRSYLKRILRDWPKSSAKGSPLASVLTMRLLSPQLKNYLSSTQLCGRLLEHQGVPFLQDQLIT